MSMTRGEGRGGGKGVERAGPRSWFAFARRETEGLSGGRHPSDKANPRGAADVTGSLERVRSGDADSNRVSLARADPTTAARTATRSDRGRDHGGGTGGGDRRAYVPGFSDTSVTRAGECRFPRTLGTALRDGTLLRCAERRRLKRPRASESARRAGERLRDDMGLSQSAAGSKDGTANLGAQDQGLPRDSVVRAEGVNAAHADTAIYGERAGTESPREIERGSDVKSVTPAGFSSPSGRAVFLANRRAGLGDGYRASGVHTRLHPNMM